MLSALLRRGAGRAAQAHHEDVARLGALAARPEQLEQVVELSVDVSADRHWAGHRVHCALLEHDLLHVLAEVLQVELSQQLTLPDGLYPSV